MASTEQQASEGIKPSESDREFSTIDMSKSSGKVNPADSSAINNGSSAINNNTSYAIDEHRPDDPFTIFIVIICYLLILVTFPISVWFCIKVVQEYERAVIFRLGRVRSGGAVGPGWFFLIPVVENFVVVDLRVIAFDVPPQELLTRDSVTVAVDAVVFYRVFSPLMAVANVSSFRSSTQFLAASTLRNTLGTRALSNILSDREAIAAHMQVSLDTATDPWGVKVERVEMKDVRLPTQLQRAMAAEAEAGREAKAKVIAAEGELTASRALKSAADVMSESPSALQLRYLQTLGTIAAEKNSTIIFPLPMEIMSQFKAKH